MAVIFEETLLNPQEQIALMERFTETYRKYSRLSPALREAHCLRVQFPAVLGGFYPQDVIAGRLGAVAIGFNPQAECMQFGYYEDEEQLKKLLAQPLSAKDRERVLALRAFWRENHTLAKIKRSYSEELWEALPDKSYVYDRAAAYPLYRLSGTHLDFGTLLRLGAGGLRRRILARRDRAADLYSAMLLALDCYTDSCRYYHTLVKAELEGNPAPERREHLLQLAQTLERIGDAPAQSFLDAIQMVILYWLLSGSFNFGRMDTYLAEYYTADIDSGVLSEEQALTLLVGMWNAMSLRQKPYDTRVVVGGEGRQDPAKGDRFTLLAIQATMQTKNVTPQLTLRFSKNTPKQVMDSAYRCIGSGATFPMLYCDEVNIPAVQKAFSLPWEEAVQYCPFGCGEYVIFHRSLGTPSGIINLLKVLELTLNNGRDMSTGEAQAPDRGNLCSYQSFDALWEAYAAQVRYFTDALALQEEAEYLEAGRDCAFLFFSMLFDDCIDRGRALLSGGVRYLGGTLESYGNINTADSLSAIRSLVYESGKVAPAELLRALQTDFEGAEPLRQQLLAQPKYGNDHPAADQMAQRVHDNVCLSTIESGRATSLHSYLIVVINNNANTVLGRHTCASADGRRAHTFMANANSPFRGADTAGPTAMLHSLVKLDTGIHAGAVQNLKLSRELFERRNAAIRAMLGTYFKNGGAQLMISVVGRQDLENAIADPASYRNLLVRVGGFSARFVELNPAEQQEILMRTLY